MGIFDEGGKFEDFPLSKQEIEKLGTFNAEVGRGLVHRPGYAFEMAKLQERYDVWVVGQNAKSGYTDWQNDQKAAVRVSTHAPYVTGGASATPEELERISEEIDANYRKDLLEDAPRGIRRDPSADALAATYGDHVAGQPVGHVHNFDRLHGFCRCGAQRGDQDGR